MKNGRFAEATDYSNRLSDRGKRAATAAQLICRQLINQGNQQDSEIERGFVNEVDGWIDVPDKASCEFDRELAERLILNLLHLIVIGAGKRVFFVPLCLVGLGQVSGCV